MNDVVKQQVMEALEAGSCSASGLFSLQVLGDSMLPEFRDGCIILIDPDALVNDGCYVLAEDGKDQYIFRQLRIHEEKYYLAPLNDLYDTVEISGLEVIKGVIVQRAGTRRKEHKHYV